MMVKNLLSQEGKRSVQSYSFLLLLLLNMTFSLSAFAQTDESDPDAYAPTVTSDKDDYAPGEVATITGSGWTLDQMVHVDFKEEPDYPDYHVYDVEVDDGGNWEIKYQVEERHLGVKFTVTAVGKQSGAMATTVFTDAGITNVRVTLNSINVTSLCQGQNIIVLFDAVTSGGNDNFNNTNKFVAQLSSATGNFSSPVVIGELTERRAGTHAINATIPSNSLLGNGYRIRVVSTNPVTNNPTNNANLTISSPPTTANAGPDQLSVNGTSTNLAGNNPSVGTGQWSIVSGTGGTISNPSHRNSPFSGTAGSTYTLRWTISNGSCTSSDNVTISFAEACTTLSPTGNATQTFCGAATVADLAATGTAIKWYGASSGGTALSASTALVNGNKYYASQTLNNCESISRLEVTVANNTTPAPTGTAEQSFCNAGTVADLSATGTSIKWYNASSGGTALASTTALEDGEDYYASQTLSSCESSSRFKVNVTINTTSTPTGDAIQSFCNAATAADLRATGTGIRWYSTSSGGTALAANTTLENGEQYYASQTDEGCESATRLAVTVSIATISAPTVGAQSFCSGGNLTVASLPQGNGSYKWYENETGGDALVSTDALSNGTYYVSQTNNACESARTSVSVTVNSTSVPTGDATQAFCGAAKVKNLAATGSNIQWYSAPSGGTALDEEDALSNGKYYASQTQNSCESPSRLEVTVTIHVTSTPTGDAIQTFCNAATVADLDANGEDGSTINWYSASSGGTALASTTALQDDEVYYASQTVDGCESSSRFKVTVNIKTTSAPSGTAAQSFCNTGTVADLAATGTSVKWYSASSGGTALAVTATLTNGNKYYASQTVDGCESEDRFEVTVTINTTAAPTGGNTQSFCQAATVANLEATGTDVKWYSTSSGGSALASTTALTNGGNYYASQTLNSCESVNRLAVTVGISQVPTTASAGTNKSMCSSGSLVLAANTPSVGTGAWTVLSGPSTATSQLSSTASPTATFTPAGGAGSYVLRWTINNAPCTASTSDVTITVNETPSITSVSNSSQNVQYSDPIANIQVEGTPTSATATAQTSKNGGAFTSGLPNGITLTGSSGTWTLSGKANVEPATYTIRVTLDNAACTTSRDITLTVNPENADVTYTGESYFSLPTATATSMKITLSATIRDITEIPGDPNYDAHAGIISNATVTFRKGSPTGTVLGTANLPVALVNGNMTGTVSTTFTYNLSSQEQSNGGTTFPVYAVVSNYYTGVNSAIPGSVTISLPGADFVTGGGFLLNSANSKGTLAGTSGAKTNFGFTMKYTKTGTNLKGQANIIVRSSNKTYQIKSNAINTLVVGSKTATGTPAHFITKANYTDITDPLNPIPGPGNLDLTIKMNDVSTGGQGDQVSIQLMNGSQLLFSSNWNVTQTILQTLGGGNIQARNTATTLSATTTSAQQVATESEVAKTPEQPTFISYPNPFSDQATITFSLTQDEDYSLEIYDMKGQLVKKLQVGKAKAGNQVQVDLQERNLPKGMYLLRLSTNSNMQHLRIIKDN